MLENWVLTLPERRDYDSRYPPLLRVRTTGAAGGCGSSVVAEPARCLLAGARLLPYILSALADETAAIREHAFDVVEAMGKEHEEFLRPSASHTIWLADAVGCMRTCHRCVVGQENAAHLKDTFDWLPEECGELPIESCRNLPPPFCTRGRPRLGARLVVRSAFFRTVAALLAELQVGQLGAHTPRQRAMSAVWRSILSWHAEYGAGGTMQEWTTDTRLNAAKLLRTSLVYVEQHVTQHLQQVLHALTLSARDEVVRDVVHECARLVSPAHLRHRNMAPVVLQRSRCG
eukprot:scaffold1621_cov350-Prasinococcus_capsulatus_cf.AAC.13